MVVRDNHRVHVIALEGDRVLSRLVNIVLGKVKIRIGARTQVEHSRTAKTAERQCLLDRVHVREVRIDTAHGVIPSQQAVTGIGGNLNSVVGMVAVNLPVTGVHKDGHVVVAVMRCERS